VTGWSRQRWWRSATVLLFAAACALSSARALLVLGAATMQEESGVATVAWGPFLMVGAAGAGFLAAAPAWQRGT